MQVSTTKTQTDFSASGYSSFLRFMWTWDELDGVEIKRNPLVWWAIINMSAWCRLMELSRSKAWMALFLFWSSSQTNCRITTGVVSRKSVQTNL